VETVIRAWWHGGRQQNVSDSLSEGGRGALRRLHVQGLHDSRCQQGVWS